MTRADEADLYGWPSCMTEDEFRAWQDANRKASPAAQVIRPCSDCPASWARQMRGLGRCEGRPTERRR